RTSGTASVTASPPRDCCRTPCARTSTRGACTGSNGAENPLPNLPPQGGKGSESDSGPLPITGEGGVGVPLSLQPRGVEPLRWHADEDRGARDRRQQERTQVRVAHERHAGL